MSDVRKDLISTHTAPTLDVADLNVIGKVYRRIIPFLLLLYAANYLDRINIGVAALTMNKDLGLTATTYGLATTAFYVGYVICEIPSNLCLAKFGARVWLGRILLTWGLASSATAFVGGMYSLYAVRAVVGIAEAGFVPGIMLYVTYWLPRSYHARANSLMIMASPTAMALGAAISGLILQHANGALGFAGWRWMFFIEGLPAIVLGVITFTYISSRPHEAHWLSEDEKERLNTIIEKDKKSNPRALSAVSKSVLRQCFSKDIILLSLIYFCFVNTISANSTWIPTIVRGLLAKSSSFSLIGAVAAIPPVCALFIMPFWARSSDRRNERRWHLVYAMGLSLIGWLLVIIAPRPEFKLLGLCCTTIGAFCSQSIFFTLPQAILSDEARPLGIGVITTIGLLGSAISPFVIGYLKDLLGTFSAGLYYVAFLLAIACIMTLCVSGGRVKKEIAVAPVQQLTR